MPNKMQELCSRAADSSLDVLELMETWSKQGINDAVLAIMGYSLFRKHHADGLKRRVV